MKTIDYTLVTQSSIIGEFGITLNGFKSVEKELVMVLVDKKTFYTKQSVDKVNKKYKFDRYVYHSQICKEFKIDKNELFIISKKYNMRNRKLGNSIMYDRVKIEKILSRKIKSPKPTQQQKQSIDYSKLRLVNPQNHYWYR